MPSHTHPLKGVRWKIKIQLSAFKVVNVHYQWNKRIRRRRGYRCVLRPGCLVLCLFSVQNFGGVYISVCVCLSGGTVVTNFKGKILYYYIIINILDPQGNIYL